MWRRHGVDSKAGQTRNAWRPCGFVLTPLATPCRSTLGARLFSVPSLSGLKMALALACLFIGHDTSDGELARGSIRRSCCVPGRSDCSIVMSTSKGNDTCSEQSPDPARWRRSLENGKRIAMILHLTAFCCSQLLFGGVCPLTSYLIINNLPISRDGFSFPQFCRQQQIAAMSCNNCGRNLEECCRPL